MIDKLVNASVTIFLLEIPALIAVAYLLPALERAGRSPSARLAVVFAAVMTPAFGIGVGFGLDGLATALGHSVSRKSLVAIAVVSNSIAFSIALRFATGARSLLFAGLAATLVVLGLIGAIFVLGGGFAALITFLVLYGLPLWHLTLGSWALGWSYSERQRLIERDPTCLHCGYDLSGLPSRLCPECGRGPGA